LEDLAEGKKRCVPNILLQQTDDLPVAEKSPERNAKEANQRN
jgi:hypothetical protein